MPTIKIFPTNSQTLNNWLKPMRQLILHLRLWQWAAVKSDKFDYFEISFTRVWEFKIYSPCYTRELFVIEIRLIKPIFYYMIPPLAEEVFCKTHGLSLEDTFGDNNPF